MKNPDQISSPELAAHYAEETRTGTILYLGGAVLSCAGAVHLDSGIESTSLGVVGGVMAYKAFDYLRQSFRYTGRARELLKEEESY